LKIYIGGDSWGLGEWAWNGRNNVNTHRGLEQYLINAGHTVHNASVSGIGNAGTYAQLVNSIAKGREYDRYILFQTCSIRDNNEWDSLIEWKDLTDRNEEIQAAYFKKYSKLPITIHMLGGLECVRATNVMGYKNLIPVIESIPEWLTGGAYVAGTLRSPVSVNCVRMTKLNFHDQLSKNISIDALDELMASNDYWTDTVSSCKNYFSGCAHANRAGHEMIYKKLKKIGLFEET